MSDSRQRAAKALAAVCNIRTAAEQVADISGGDGGVERIACDLTNLAVVLEIFALSLNGELWTPPKQ